MPEDDRFDQITRTAEQLFNVPVALVNFFGNNWYSHCQIEFEFYSEEILKNSLFWQNSSLSNEPFVISDISADLRFKDNSFVKKNPRVRFYAGMPLRNEYGEIVGILALIDFKPRIFSEIQISALVDIAAWAKLKLDILKVRQDNSLAKKKETRLQLLIESVGDAIIAVEERGRIKTFNSAAARIFGYKSESIIGRHAGRLTAKNYRSQVCIHMQEFFLNTAELGKEFRRDVMGKHADGTTFDAEIVVAQIKIEGNREYIAIVRDISVVKKNERIKNDLISTVSHELRTPLTSICGSLRLLLGGVVGEIPIHAKKLLDIANNNCERLIRLINDILDIQKIESGHMNFEIGIYPLIVLVRQAIDATQLFAMQFHVKFNLQISDFDELICVSVDPDYLVRVIVNLLSNAVKFSPVGSTVNIKIKNLGRSIRLLIIDQGSGIPEEFRDRIFSKFAQAASSNPRQKIIGTGLGLSISKLIIERLGGNLGFNSNLGTGSEFFFDLPMVDNLRLIGHQVVVNILICEVDCDRASALVQMFEKNGLHSHVALTTEQAQSMFIMHDYHVIMLNFELPDEGCSSLLHWLRSEKKTRNLPVVMFSVQAYHQKNYSDGIDGGVIVVLDWMIKPIDEARIFTNLSVFKKQNGRPCMLYVKNHSDFTSTITELLEPTWDIVHSINLGASQKLLEQQKFSVIILDIQLPNRDDFEVLCALSILNVSTPVIIFSNQEISQDVLKNFQLALEKSRISNEQLLETLNVLVGINMIHVDRTISI